MGCRQFTIEWTQALAYIESHGNCKRTVNLSSCRSAVGLPRIYLPLLKAKRRSSKCLKMGSHNEANVTTPRLGRPVRRLLVNTFLVLGLLTSPLAFARPATATTTRAANGGKIHLAPIYSSRTFSCPMNATRVSRIVGHPMFLNPGGNSTQCGYLSNLASVANGLNGEIVVNFDTSFGNVIKELRAQSKELSPDAPGCRLASVAGLGRGAFMDSCSQIGGQSVSHEDLNFVSPGGAYTWTVEVTWYPGAPSPPSLASVQKMIRRLISN
jgi:hypothetical protein